MEALAASARSLCVRIIENKFTFYFVVYVVHFHADHKHQGLRVNDYFNSLMFDNLIKLSYFIFLALVVVHYVRVTITTSSFDS